MRASKLTKIALLLRLFFTLQYKANSLLVDFFYFYARLKM